METIKWIDKVKNEEVLSRAGESKPMREVKKKRSWLGFVIRGRGNLTLTLEGLVDREQK